MLEFDGSWRYDPPPDGEYRNSTIPQDAVPDFLRLITQIGIQRNQWDTLEHFKRTFSGAAGTTSVRSSSEGWAATDLSVAMEEASANAPLFIEAFYDGCEGLRGEGIAVPDPRRINRILEDHQIGYIIDPPRLLLREQQTAPIAVPAGAQTLSEQANEMLQQSLHRSEQLLMQGQGREAVQEALWVLESVSTAFRDADSEGNTVGGRYFNEIVRNLRRAARGTTLDRVLAWCSALHGYLSSPTGGGVRHGLDLREGLQMDPHEARLFM